MVMDRNCIFCSDICDELWVLQKEYTLHNVSMPISNLEAETGDNKDGIIGYKKHHMSLKQCVADVLQRIQRPQSIVDCSRPHCSM